MSWEQLALTYRYNNLPLPIAISSNSSSSHIPCYVISLNEKIFNSTFFMKIKSKYISVKKLYIYLNLIVDYSITENYCFINYYFKSHLRWFLINEWHKFLRLKYIFNSYKISKFWFYPSQSWNFVFGVYYFVTLVNYLT